MKPTMSKLHQPPPPPPNEPMLPKLNQPQPLEQPLSMSLGSSHLVSVSLMKATWRWPDLIPNGLLSSQDSQNEHNNIVDHIIFIAVALL